MKNLFAFIIPLMFVFSAKAQTNDELLVRKILATQTAACNAGNIEGFMEGYWHNDSLMFIGKSGPTYGWENTLNNYKRSYPDTATMGKLDFQLISVKRLSVLYYSVVGKWHLKRTKDDVGGAFTLLFKKIKGKWVIVQDHSS